MKPRRIQRVNSLLKEVLSEVIMHDIKHRNIPELITITEVDTAADLTSAKVFISLIADSRQKKKWGCGSATGNVWLYRHSRLKKSDPALLPFPNL